MRRIVSSDVHKDCSLCKRLSPPVLITFGDKESFQWVNRKKRRIGLELTNGDDLLFPEKIYNKDSIPCYEFHCGHRYHVPCLARLNPNKYTDITFRKDGIRDTLELNEFHCIDCRGTQQINYIFNPDIEGNVNITEPTTGTIYINVPDVFEQVETDMATFLARYDQASKIKLDLHTLINEGYTRKEIEEEVLPDMKLKVVKFLTLEKPTALYNHVPSPSTRKYALMNRFTNKPLEFNDVSLVDLTHGIDVDWNEEDKESFKTRQMDIIQLNLDYKDNHLHIRRLNRLAEPIKRYLNGDTDARKSIDENSITKAMLYGIIADSTNRLCVKNYAGEVKTLVTFHDFPIRETSSCSIMGGTRKKKGSKKKTLKNRI